MLPSKIKPTISPARLTTGDPEFPPMMSFVVTKSSGVDKSSLSREAMTRCVSANGGFPLKLADRSKSPKNVVL